MRASIYRHAKLGELHDRLSVHQYAVGYAIDCFRAAFRAARSVDSVASPDSSATAKPARDDVLAHIGACLARLEVRAERDAAGQRVSISGGFAGDLQHALREAEKFIAAQPQADHIADTSNMVPPPLVGLALGPVAFEFSSFAQWVNRAQSWFHNLAATNRNAAMKRYLCVDAAGRVCMIGKDFHRARDEDKFPVRLYLIDAAPDEANPEK